jgi:hypothetical protein
MADEDSTEERPLLDTVIGMNAVSIELTDLDDRELMLVRLAALVAVDAPVSSYFFNIGGAAGTSLTLEDARSILVAVAPLVGAPRVISAAGTIAEALGLAVAIDDALQTTDD